jgi:hypothetical protein
MPPNVPSSSTAVTASKPAVSDKQRVRFTRGRIRGWPACSGL